MVVVLGIDLTQLWLCTHNCVFRFFFPTVPCLNHMTMFYCYTPTTSLDLQESRWREFEHRIRARVVTLGIVLHCKDVSPGSGESGGFPLPGLQKVWNSVKPVPYAMYILYVYMCIILHYIILCFIKIYYVIFHSIVKWSCIILCYIIWYYIIHYIIYFELSILELYKIILYYTMLNLKKWYYIACCI